MTGSKMPSLMARLALRLAIAIVGLMPLQASAEEMLAPFQRSDGLWGYVNGDHCWAIEARFREAGHFYDGLARVDIGGKSGFIDKTGRMVINPQFDFANHFSEGFASV